MRKIIFTAVVVGAVFGICPVASPQISSQSTQATKSQSKSKESHVAPAGKGNAAQGRVIGLTSEEAGRYRIIASIHEAKVSAKGTCSSGARPPHPWSPHRPCFTTSIDAIRGKGVESVQNLIFVAESPVSRFDLEVYSAKFELLWRAESFTAMSSQASRGIFKLDAAGALAVAQNFKSGNFITIVATAATSVERPHQISIALKTEQ
jgi:hypothetical protein